MFGLVSSFSFLVMSDEMYHHQRLDIGIRNMTNVMELVFNPEFSSAQINLFLLMVSLVSCSWIPKTFTELDIVLNLQNFIVYLSPAC